MILPIKQYMERCFNENTQHDLSGQHSCFSQDRPRFKLATGSSIFQQTMLRACSHNQFLLPNTRTSPQTRPRSHALHSSQRVIHRSPIHGMPRNSNYAAERLGAVKRFSQSTHTRIFHTLLGNACDLIQLCQQCVCNFDSRKVTWALGSTRGYLQLKLLKGESGPFNVRLISS